jgi:hypothetical protein
VNLGDAILALVDLGLLPVIALAALLGLAVGLYRRFRDDGGGELYMPRNEDGSIDWESVQYHDWQESIRNNYYGDRG